MNEYDFIFAKKSERNHWISWNQEKTMYRMHKKLCEGIDERLTFDLTKRPQSAKITSAQHTLQRIKFITVKWKAAFAAPAVRGIYAQPGGPDTGPLPIPKSEKRGVVSYRFRQI